MASNVVILGAGIGGLSVVRELRDSGVDLADVDITLVAEDFDHYLGFTLPWVMRGWRDEPSVPIRPAADTLAGISTVTGSACDVDPVGRTVGLADGRRIGFDALVIATGARNAIDRVPGLGDAVDSGTAVHYYSAAAAAGAHRALQAFTGGRLVFLITALPYRCPVAPYEGTLLAADLLRSTGVRDATEIAIYTPERNPMPSAGPHAGPELVKMLNANGIGFHGEHDVARIDADGRLIEFRDGTSTGYDLLVFIPPHEPTLKLGDADWIAVDPVTMATEHPGIWAVGDTTVIASSSGHPLPKAATFARNGAAAAARSVLHHLGRSTQAGTLSGRGYCYIDTGDHRSTRGLGDFFAHPHPDIRLSPPSTQMYADKQQEERDWRAAWRSA
ncbi:NAD(P)/FAD-dependent oxidoreductase [Mycobacterium sp. M1]|uniref:NAD(P)/FAD-dependent oxidoreductase n=1 Tax=Mycolicibacter acidiphilus TaxID=2835306 RepID=A0ABS5RMM8_9MYCO|nr:FAD/NAD(P)-binding oxidoreductase [Mycolicibacter acidiphilus]MBS9535439.1 NAD(P)/FAD-dependent oxidoreductase [Mycolicibacter acidiphilus]